MKSVFTSLAMLFCTLLFAQAGTLDPSFGVNGVYESSERLYDHDDEIRAVKVLPDGKILLAGGGNSFTPTGSRDFSIFRLNANGTLDSSFGINGKVYIDFTIPGDYIPTNDIVAAMSLQADGKIVIAGTLGLSPNGPTNNIYNYDDIGVARLNSNGSIDSSFNLTGKKRIDLSTYTNNSLSMDYCTGVAIRNNGKIVMSGYTYNNNSKTHTYTIDNDATVVQVNADGSFDSTFSGDGIQIYPKGGTDEVISGAALQSDGKLVLAGYTGLANVSTNNNFLLVRINTNGTLDTTFNGAGYVTTDLQNKKSDNATCLVILSTGKIVVGGYTTNDTVFIHSVLRYSANGKLDFTFGTKGKSIIDTISRPYRTTSLSAAPDGKLIVTAEDFSIYRCLPNGVKDSSFGTYGKINIGGSDPSYCYASAVQPDSKIIAAGTASYTIPHIGGGRTETAIRILGSAQNSFIAKGNDQTKDLKAINPVANATNLNTLVFPNPSHDHFTIRTANNNRSEKINISVVNASGKVMEVFSNLQAGDTKQFGSRYLSGTYFVSVIQGNYHQTFTVIKL